MGSVIKLAADNSEHDYDSFIANTARILGQYDVKGIAIVALLENDGFPAITGYWKMNQCDKAYAAVHIQADSIDQMVGANMHKYIEFVE